MPHVKPVSTSDGSNRRASQQQNAMLGKPFPARACRRTDPLPSRSFSALRTFSPVAALALAGEGREHGRCRAP